MNAILNYTNTTSNCKTPPRYIFSSLSNQAKIVLCLVECLASVSGITANVVLLYLMWKQQRKQEHMLRSINRVIKIVFIYSLALSNLACCVFSFPISVIATFYDIYTDDIICKAARWCNYSFPTVTAANIVVLGVERYLSVFHPLKVPTTETVRKLLVGAWGIGVTFSLMPSLANTLQKVPIDEERYTHVCRVDSDHLIHKTLLMIYSVIGYLFSMAFLIYVNIRITRFLRRRRRTNIAIRMCSSDIPVTSASVSIIVMFIFPYFMAFAFGILRMFIKVRLTYESDIIFRRAIAIIAYSNAVINPAFIIYKIPKLKKAITDMFTRGRTSSMNRSRIGTLVHLHSASLELTQIQGSMKQGLSSRPGPQNTRDHGPVIIQEIRILNTINQE